MFYLAHLSDIHLSPLPPVKWPDLLGKRLTGYINWQKHRSHNQNNATLNHLSAQLLLRGPQHIAITGDLVNLALEQEFYQARTWLESLGSPQHVSLTFGNHDAYVRGGFKKACEVFAPWISGDIATPWRAPFPYMRIRDNVAIIGLSSAIATPPFFATGYFGPLQAKRLAQLLQYAKDQGLFRTLLIHHPPFKGATHMHKVLWGIARFQKVVKTYGAELILHGHTHVPSSTQMVSYDGQRIPIIGVAAASQSFGGRKPAANFNWFAIDQRQNKFRCTLSRYSIQNEQNFLDCSETITLF